jgi:hypothetical protein
VAGSPAAWPGPRGTRRGRRIWRASLAGGHGRRVRGVGKPGDRVRLDLNSPEFQEVFFGLESDDLKQVVASLRRLRSLSWPELYRHTGFRWEAIRHIRTPTGATAYSLRLGQKVRAIAYRDGAYLRLVSLHPDHDSAYGG